MSRHSKRPAVSGSGNQQKRTNPGEAANDSRFSHFVDDDDSYQPFAEIKKIKPQQIPSASQNVGKKIAQDSSTAQTAFPSSRSSRPISSSGPSSSDSARVKPSAPKKIVGGYDPSADFGDILRQWEATGDPYAMPGQRVSDGSGVGRRLKKDKVADRPIGKIEDTTQTARKAVRSMDFAQIFAQWESSKNGTAKGSGNGNNSGGRASGKGGVADQMSVSRSRVVTKGPRKDFAEILAEWEASQVGKNVVKRAETVGKQSVPTDRQRPPKGEAPEAVAADEDSEVEVMEVADGRPRPVWSAGRPTSYGAERISGGGGFADIYDKWAAEQREDEEERLAQAVQEKEADAKPSPQLELSKLRQMLPQVTLDLHGLTAEEAGRRVGSFLQDSYRNGMKKICIIHGKGIHAPQGQGVLKDVVLCEIERSKVVREYSIPPAKYGGSGVLWLILKA